MNAETGLLVAATAPAARADSRPDEFARVNWLAAAQLARRNKVLPRLVRFAASLASHGPDPSDWTPVEAAARQMAQRAALRHLETLAIVDTFGQRGLPVCALKGTLLSQLLYGDAALRHAGDIDLLVPPDRFAEAHDALVRRGYRLMRPSVLPAPDKIRWLLNANRNYNVMLFDPHRRLRIELHWRLSHYRRFPGEQTSGLWQRLLWQRLETDERGPLRIAMMRDDDLLLYLALHGLKDQWRRLSWLADFARLAVIRAGSVPDARAMANENGLVVAWETACRLADEWYGTRLARPAGSSLMERRVRYLVSHVSLLRPNPVAIAGGARRFAWNSYDARRASLGQLVRSFVSADYQDLQEPADFDPASQLRARIRRQLRRLV